MRRLHGRYQGFQSRVIGNPRHADVAVAPGLPGNPLDKVIVVFHFFNTGILVDALRPSRAARAAGHFNIAAAHEEIPRPRLDIDAGCAPDAAAPGGGRPDVIVLIVQVERGQAYQRREFAFTVRAGDIDVQFNAVPHRDGDIRLVPDFVLSRGYFPVTKNGIHG